MTRVQDLLIQKTQNYRRDKTGKYKTGNNKINKYQYLAAFRYYD